MKKQLHEPKKAPKPRIFKYIGLDGNEYALTPQQKLFAEMYCDISMDGKKAVVEAGYNCTNKNGTINWNLAHVIASENLKKPTIYRYIDLLLERYGLSEEHVDKQLLAVVNQWADLSAKVRAIDILYKKRGAYAPEKHEHSVSEELEKAFERMAAILPKAGN